MLSSICFSLARPLTTMVFIPFSNALGVKTQWPVTSGDVLFHACNYKDQAINIYRDDVIHTFTSDGYDWTPIE